MSCRKKPRWSTMKRDETFKIVKLIENEVSNGVERRISANINSDSSGFDGEAAATTAENPPRCMAIYKIVQRITLVFSNIYRFACSSFAVVVCIFTSFVLFICVFLFSIFAFFQCSLFDVRNVLLFSTVVLRLCGRERERERNYSYCVVYMLWWLEFFTVHAIHSVVVVLDAGYSGWDRTHVHVQVNKSMMNFCFEKKRWI